MLLTSDFSSQVAILLDKAGLSSTIISIENCVKGGNNRTYRVKTHDGVFAVKQYFRQESDKRDRLGSEYAFLEYATKVVSNSVPIPYQQNTEMGLALYEFIAGKVFQPTEITENDVAQAIKFFCALNQPEARTLAAGLPLASEACFSIQAHLDLIGARIDALQKIDADSAIDKLAQQMIQRLNIHWQSIVAEVRTAIAADRDDASLDLNPQQRCISPSDFGFHNALKDQNGTIRFLDFEYAGWDDPAKMVGDFFAQLAIPIPAKFFQQFVSEVMTCFPQSNRLIRRAQILRVVYQMKWCCIALNVFLPIHMARRKFANPDLNIIELKQAQLTKVEKLMQNLEVLSNA